MNYGFIYPCDPFDSKKVEETFEEEFLHIKKCFPTFLINVDDLDSIKQYRAIKEANLQYIYRGWMLKPEDYQKLENACNGLLITDTQNYLNAHYLPNWYNNLSDLTPESIITNQEGATLAFEKSGWNKAFIKDYVKSLKTGKGSIIDSKEDIDRALKDMLHYRGFIEGGVVLRQVHDFIAETEKRFFIINGNINSPTGEISENEKRILDKVIERQSNLCLYSVDLITDKNDKVWLVEIGDGQVSDCVGWNPEAFAKSFDILLKANENKLKM